MSLSRFFVFVMMFTGCTDNGAPEHLSTLDATGLVGTPDTSADSEEPQLIFSIDEQPFNSVSMGQSDTKLFCFSLEAKGADLSVRLPLMQIEASDGGLIQTTSMDGVVFERPSIKESTKTVIGPVKVSVSDDFKTAFLTWFRETRFQILRDTVHHYCVTADIVSWSLTPEDFNGHVYRVIMHDWGNEDVQVSETFLFLSRSQITAPQKVFGDAVVIASEEGPHPAPYSGELFAALVDDASAAKAILPGEQNVAMMSFVLIAGGNGACVRGIDVTRHGIGTDQDIEGLVLYDDTLAKALYPTKSHNASATFGWHDFGLLFCLEAGESHRFTVFADFETTAKPHDTYAISIDNVHAIDRVKGLVNGPFPLNGNALVVGSP